MVFSATDSHTLAQERAELGHVTFTYALTQGLRGGAALGGDDVGQTGLLGFVSRASALVKCQLALALWVLRRVRHPKPFIDANIEAKGLVSLHDCIIKWRS